MDYSKGAVTSHKSGLVRRFSFYVITCSNSLLHKKLLT